MPLTQSFTTAANTLSPSSPLSISASMPELDSLMRLPRSGMSLLPKFSLSAADMSLGRSVFSPQIRDGEKSESTISIFSAPKVKNKFLIKLESYEEQLKKNVDDVEAYFQQGILLHMLNRHQEARQSLVTFLKSKPNHVVALMYYGTVLYELKSLREAQTAFEKILKFDVQQNNADLLHARAIALYFTNKNKEAMVSCKQAYELRPKDPAIANDLGFLLAENGKHEEALHYYQLAVKLDADYFPALANQCTSLNKLKRWKEALECLTQYLGLWPDNVDIIFQQAELLLSLGEANKAIACYNVGLVKNPFNSDLRTALNKTLAIHHAGVDDKQDYPSVITLPKNTPASISVAIGGSDFKSMVEQGSLLVDKTLLIKDIIDDKTQVKLIIRPRRFGKTLNMSMLKYFFEKTEIKHEHAGLFKDRSIWLAGELYQREQGQYPVLFITFKEVNGDKYNDAYAKVQYLLSELYKEYRDSLFNGILKNRSFEQKDYDAVVERKADLVVTKNALKKLTEHLHKAYGKPTIVLIDEYDTPLHASQEHGYYPQMTTLLKDMLSPLIKDNPSLYRGVITGILRVAKEGIFSGLNNIKLFSMLSDAYAAHFGFSLVEVKSLLGTAATPDVLDTLESWHGGYQIGSRQMFNPWSIINFIQDNLYTTNNKAPFCPYWLDTAENTLLVKQFGEPDNGMKNTLKALLENKSIVKEVSEHIVFSDIAKNKEMLWSFLLLSGYLTVSSATQESYQGSASKELLIPNKEIYIFYETLSRSWLKDEKIPFAFKRLDKVYMSSEEKAAIDNHKSYYVKAVNDQDKLLVAETLISYGYADNAMLQFLIQKLLEVNPPNQRRAQNLLLNSNVIKQVNLVDKEVGKALLVAQRYKERSNIVKYIFPLLTKFAISLTKIVENANKALRNDDDAVRKTALEILKHLALADAEKSALPLLLLALQDKDKNVQQTVADFLYPLDGSNEKFVNSLLDMVRQKEPDKKQAAIAGLGFLDKRNVTVSKILLEMLGDGNLSIRHLAAEAFLRTRSNSFQQHNSFARRRSPWEDTDDARSFFYPEVADELFELDNVNVGVPDQKSKELTNSGDAQKNSSKNDQKNRQAVLTIKLPEALVVVLILALEDADDMVRQAATKVFSQLKKPTATIMSALLKRVRDKNEQIRHLAVEALSRLGDVSEPVVNELLKMLLNKDRNVRRAAVKSLRKSINKIGIVTKELLTLLQDQDESVRGETVKVLGYLEKPDELVISALLRRLEDEEYAVRMSTVEVLNRLINSHEIVFNTLLNLLQHKDDSVWRTAMEVLKHLKDPSEIKIKMLLQTLPAKRNNADWYAEKGIIFDKLKLYEEGLLCDEEALKLEPNNANRHRFKAISLSRLNRNNEALVCYEQALKLEPTNALYHRSKGVAFEHLKRYDEALVCYEQALKLEPTNALYHRSKGVAFEHLKRYDEALVCYEQALKLEPTNALYHRSKGVALTNLKRYDEALVCYEQALKLEPTNALYHQSKGVALTNLKRHDEALVCYEQALKLEPTNALYHQSKGVAFEHLKRYDEALVCYEQALKLEPTNALYHRSKGVAFEHLKRYDEALVCYEQALKLEPTNALYHRSKGVAFEHLKRYDEALVCYEQALKLEPTNALYHRSKGVAFEHLKRYDEALVCYEQALKLEPTNANHYKSKGTAYFRLNLFQEALISYNKALELKFTDTDDFITCCNDKANTLYQLKCYAEAADNFVKVLQLNPSPELQILFDETKKDLPFYLAPEEGKQQALAKLQTGSTTLALANKPVTPVDKKVENTVLITEPESVKRFKGEIKDHQNLRQLESSYSLFAIEDIVFANDSFKQTITALRAVLLPLQQHSLIKQLTLLNNLTQQLNVPACFIAQTSNTATLAYWFGIFTRQSLIIVDPLQITLESSIYQQLDKLKNELKLKAVYIASPDNILNAKNFAANSGVLCVEWLRQFVVLPVDTLAKLPTYLTTASKVFGTGQGAFTYQTIQLTDTDLLPSSLKQVLAITEIAKDQVKLLALRQKHLNLLMTQSQSPEQRDEQALINQQLNNPLMPISLMTDKHSQALNKRFSGIAKIYMAVNAQLDIIDQLSLLKKDIPLVIPSYKQSSSQLSSSQAIEAPSSTARFLENSRQNFQRGWNCFDLAIGLDTALNIEEKDAEKRAKTTRNKLVAFALDEKNITEFRRLLAPEIRHAAGLTTVYLNLQKEKETANKDRNTRLAELFGVAEVLTKARSNEASTQAVVMQQITKLLTEDDRSKQDVNEINFDRHMLPMSLQTKALRKLVNKYQFAHDMMQKTIRELCAQYPQMQAAVTACKQTLSQAQNNRVINIVSAEELYQFLQTPERQKQYPVAWEVYHKQYQDNFVPHEQALQGYCEDEKTYRTYVNDYYGKQGWVAFQRSFKAEGTSTSMVDIAARLLNAQIVVCQKNPTIQNAWEEIYCTATPVQNNKKVYVQFNGRDHFMALQENPAYTKKLTSFAASETAALIANSSLFHTPVLSHSAATTNPNTPNSGRKPPDLSSGQSHANFKHLM